VRKSSIGELRHKSEFLRKGEGLLGVRAKSFLGQSSDLADSAGELRRDGIALDEHGADVYIAHKNGELKKAFKGTQWEKNWRDSFDRVQGTQCSLSEVFGSGRT